MDALLFTALVKELAARLPGAKIQRIDQPSPGEIWLHMRKPGENLRLVLCADGDLATAYLSTRQKDQAMPAVPPSFCLLLRRRLVGGKIESLSQPELERICSIDVISGDELGNPMRWRLVAEIMGKRSNLVLIDTDATIAGVLRPVGISHNRYRQLLPGLQYVSPPPITKAHPAIVSASSFSGTSLSRTWAEAIVSCVAGFSPKLAQEACVRAGIDPSSLFSEGAADAMAAACRQIWNEAQEARQTTVCSDSTGAPLWCHVLDLGGECGEKQRFPSVSAALEYTHIRSLREREFQSHYHAIRQALAARMDKVAKRLAAREEDLKAAADREDLKHKADLVLTYLPQVEAALKARAAAVSLPDPVTGTMVDVSLNLSLDAPGNAQQLYKRYAKSRAAERSLRPQIERDRTEMAYLSSVDESLELACNTTDLSDIRAELVQQGIVEDRRDPAPAKKGHTGAVRQPEPDRFKASTGDEVLLGRNNRQSDFLTFKIARPQDIWFHVKGFSGAHVVLRTKNGQASDKAIFEAATLAATSSSGRGATKVEVDYTQIRHVRKMPGGKPGMVIYDDYRTIVVKPDASMLQALRFRPQ